MLIVSGEYSPLHIVGINGKGDVVVIFVNGFNIGQSDFGSLFDLHFCSQAIKIYIYRVFAGNVVWREFGEVGNFVRFRIGEVCCRRHDRIAVVKNDFVGSGSEETRFNKSKIINICIRHHHIRHIDGGELCLDGVIAGFTRKSRFLYGNKGGSRRSGFIEGEMQSLYIGIVIVGSCEVVGVKMKPDFRRLGFIRFIGNVG